LIKKRWKGNRRGRDIQDASVGGELAGGRGVGGGEIEKY